MNEIGRNVAEAARGSSEIASKRLASDLGQLVAREPLEESIDIVDTTIEIEDDDDDRGPLQHLQREPLSPEPAASGRPSQSAVAVSVRRRHPGASSSWPGGLGLMRKGTSFGTTWSGVLPHDKPKR